ncbi:hypothetical protein JXA32_01050 [Candidatus Sumerlaeota bacterium]|nr:hypothetical protein [Candidatus Sumerlaeota bacterium]
MTLVEFLSPLSKGTHQDRVLAVLYFRERYEKVTALAVDDIRQGLKSCRITGWSRTNVADVLNKSGALVDTAGVDGRKRLWSLTDSGREHVRHLLGLPETDVEIEHDVGTLETLMKSISGAEVKGYLGEALKCLQVGALRACVVFLWTGAIRELQQTILTHGVDKVNAAIQMSSPLFEVHLK